MGTSPFLEVEPKDWVASNDLAFALRDRFPVSPGHTLIVPKRHVPTWFDATRDEQRALMDLVGVVKRALDEELHPDGYNVGFNAGAVAGQTVMHLHVHVIPRFQGDMDDPRGGVRGVIPWKQRYATGPADPSSDPFAALPSFVHGDDAHLEQALRSALLHADRADILSAFVQTSGVDLLKDDLRDALRRGAKVRLLTGDYLGVTSPDALRRLLSLADEHPSFEPYFFEVKNARSFHPKAYLFFQGAHGVAYVGSSNLSERALKDGIEWNLRLVSAREQETFLRIAHRFEALLRAPSTTRLSRAVIEAYEARVPERPAPQPEPRAAAPTPNAVQKDALLALSATRRAGKSRGLVVLATGLGKTFLSAFDFRALGGERALFIAHREEILTQAKDTWQRVFPEKLTGLYHGDARDKDADLLFASVQTLYRAHHLSRFSPRAFDYIVIDEFHHAAAATYRKVLGHFEPRFLLGLTATPERMDGRSLLELCDDNLVFQRDLAHGVLKGLLVPFRYFGVKDSVDFEPIPWRSGKFDNEALTSAVATEARAAQALREYDKHAPQGLRRALVFCCSTRHADFMAEYLRRQGRSASAVHSGPGSASRGQSLQDLKAGTLEFMCTVDIFNEGVDVPDVNTVLMLRPTESPTIFLQQLGRGLRRAEGKTELVVVDFIGNHRSFLSKPQSLAFLLGQDLPPKVALDKIAQGTLELPPGCSVEVATQAIELLRSMVRESPTDALLYEYTTFRDTHGRRPTAAELLRRGLTLKPTQERFETWFHFVAEQGDLSEEERRVLATHGAWLRDVQVTPMTKSYKMLALRALLDADQAFEGMSVEDNARRAFEAARHDLLLFRELKEDEGRAALGPAFTKKWRDMPLKKWVGADGTSRPWFALEDESFVPLYAVADGDRHTFEEMSEELVELRLAQHRDRLIRSQREGDSPVPIVLQVSHSNFRPILRFDRERRPDIPEGVVPVVVQGETFSFDFKKIAVNVARRAGSNVNALPDVLRRLLGPATGQPGIRHRVRLVRNDDAWQLEREDVAPAVSDACEVIPFPRLPYFADVRAACGLMESAVQQSDASELAAVRTDRPVDPKKHFLVRADGDSMSGGDLPIADGDLVLCEWTRGLDASQVEGKPFLLVGSNAAETSFAVIKVPRRRDGRWSLESTNPSFAPQPVPQATKLEPVARVLDVVSPALGLVLYGSYDRNAIAAAFGSKNDPSWKVGHRDLEVLGTQHTVLMITLKKSSDTKLEHRYADHFDGREELAWDSQASTTADSLKGRRIRGADGVKRTIHLFAHYDKRSAFTYLGPVRYLSHDGEAPMHVRFALEKALPEELWRQWSG